MKTNTNTDQQIVIPRVKMSRRELFWALVLGRADIVIHIEASLNTEGDTNE